MTRKEQIENAATMYSEGYIIPEDRYASKAAFMDGAEWADKTMIEKACEWLRKNKDNYGCIATYDVVSLDDDVDVFVSDRLIEDFKQAMEE